MPKPKQRQRRRSSAKPEWQLKIARERMDILFEETRRRAPSDPKLANRYVELARKIGMRYNVRLPPELKRKICKGCKAYLALGITAKQRVKQGRVIITCNACGHANRYPFSKET
jgi:ribonuclease P protein subunit RPR2